MRAFFAPAVISLIVFAEAYSSQAVDSYKLNQLMDLAIQKNEDALIANSKLAQSQAQVDQARGSALPNVNLTASYTKEDDADVANRNDTQKAARINLNQPILGVLKNIPAIDAAKSYMNQSKMAVEETNLQIKIAVNTAFHRVLSASQDIDTMTQLNELTQKRVKELTNRTRIGQSKPSDLYAAQAQLAASDGQLEEARGELQDAQHDLTKVTGLEGNLRVEESVQLPQKLDSVEDYLAKVDEQPNIRRLKESVDGSQLAVRAARAQHMPDLDFFANYYLYREKPLDDIKWDVGLQLSVPIFQGGATSAKILEASEKKNESEYRLNQERRVYADLIRREYAAVDRGIRQIDLLKKAHELADKSYTQIDRDYRSGLATNLEVIQAFNSVAEARRALARQVVSTKTSYVTLLLSAGRTL